MKHEYRYESVDGHIIALVDGLRVLIDTGAPSTVAESSPLVMAGRSFPTQRSYLGVTPPSLSASVGCSFHALVGADVLNQHDLHLDPGTQTLTMTEDELPLAGKTLPLASFMGIPIVEGKIGQDEVKMFFDTGAKLSYLHSERTAALPSVGMEGDFYPMFGEFITSVYDVAIDLAGEVIPVRVGTLPQRLQTTLMMAGTDGILGTVLLLTHKVTFAPRRELMAIERR